MIHIALKTHSYTHVKTDARETNPTFKEEREQKRIIATPIDPALLPPFMVT